MSRGQAHTLEAVAAALVLLGSIVFALQSTAVTPLTASTASQHIENQQAEVGEGLLDAAAENGTLKEALLYWNDDTGCFHGSTACPNHAYSDGGPPLPFGETLNETFRDRGIAFNLNVVYVDVDDFGNQELVKRQLVNFGRSSDHAVTVRRTVTLHDDDVLLAPDGSKTGTTLADANNYFAPNLDRSGSVYNVVQVELVLWRM